jgi:hypothetical protein
VDPHLVIAGPGPHRSGRWIQLCHRAAEVAAEEPSGADKWVSRERQPGGRGEDPELAGVRVVDIDSFGKPSSAAIGCRRSGGIAGPSTTTPRGLPNRRRVQVSAVERGFTSIVGKLAAPVVR